jgi:hypothetical protein
MPTFQTQTLTKPKIMSTYACDASFLYRDGARELAQVMAITTPPWEGQLEEMNK